MTTIHQILSDHQKWCGSLLDTEVLLAHVLEQDRSYLWAHADDQLDNVQFAHFDDLTTNRRLGEPVAYLTGVKEFWSLQFEISKHVLVPRPETELLVEAALAATDKPHCRLLDLGTGCGNIAISIASERGSWDIFASDITEACISNAKRNALNLLDDDSTLTFFIGHWCESLRPDYFDIVVSNPPYVSHQDIVDLAYEPERALFSENAGLGDLTEIIRTAAGVLKSGGKLILEHGYAQADEVKALMATTGYQNVVDFEDLAGHRRACQGEWYLCETSGTLRPHGSPQSRLTQKKREREVETREEGESEMDLSLGGSGRT